MLALLEAPQDRVEVARPRDLVLQLAPLRDATQQVCHVQWQLVDSDTHVRIRRQAAQAFDGGLAVVRHLALAEEGIHLAAQIVEDHAHGVRAAHLGEAGQSDLLAGTQHLAERDALIGEIDLMQKLATREFHDHAPRASKFMVCGTHAPVNADRRRPATPAPCDC